MRRMDFPRAVSSWRTAVLLAPPAAGSSTPSSPTSSIPETSTRPRGRPRSASARSPTSHSRRMVTEPRRKMDSSSSPAFSPTSSSFHDAAVGAGDRPAHHRDHQPEPFGRLPQPASRPGRRRARGRAAAEVRARARQHHRHRRDADALPASPTSISARISAQACRSAEWWGLADLRHAADHGADLRRRAGQVRLGAGASGTVGDEEGTITNLAAVGRGRALLDLGLLRRCGSRGGRGPHRFRLRHRALREPVAASECRVGRIRMRGSGRSRMPRAALAWRYRAAEDPRVPFTDFEDTGLDLITPQFSLDKYPDAAAVDPSGRRHRGPAYRGRGAAAGQQLLRHADDPERPAGHSEGLDPLPTPGNRDAAIDQLFSERAFWLFATGHRLGDMRRWSVHPADMAVM